MKHSIPSFTIFEVTVVMAIMSVLVTMISFSVNRLFESLHKTEVIHGELNAFYRLRSTLWYDCVTADSMICENNELYVFQNTRKVNYSLDEGMLVRTCDGITMPMEQATEEITATETEAGVRINFQFNWKGELLNWHFVNRPDRAGNINQFFDRRNG